MACVLLCLLRVQHPAAHGDSSQDIRLVEKAPDHRHGDYLRNESSGRTCAGVYRLMPWGARGLWSQYEFCGRQRMRTRQERQNEWLAGSLPRFAARKKGGTGMETSARRFSTYRGFGQTAGHDAIQSPHS